MNVRWYSGKDWLGAAATLFALAVTFNAEYEIAIAVHIHPIVAYAVPGALDVYVLRALQVKRDVFLTVLAMVLVNAASHLVGAGVLRVSPALIVGVSAIAPLVLWRAHVLRHEVSTEPIVPPVPEHVPAVPEAQIRAQTDARGNDWEAVPGSVPAFPDVCSTCFYKHEGTCPDLLDVPGFEEHAAQAVDVASTGAVNVPEHWCGHGHDHAEHRHTAYDTELVCLGVGADRYGEYGHDDMKQITRAWHAKHITGCTCPVCFDGWDGTVVDLQGNTEHAFPASDDIAYPGEYEASTEARVLSLVPPLPAGFEPVLEEGDKEFLDRARTLYADTGKLSVRALKEHLNVGTPRAQRIKQYLDLEHTETRS